MLRSASRKSLILKQCYMLQSYTSGMVVRQIERTQQVHNITSLEHNSFKNFQRHILIYTNNFITL